MLLLVGRPHPSQVKEKAEEMDLPVSFHDAIDHAELGNYKVMILLPFASTAVVVRPKHAE